MAGPWLSLEPLVMRPQGSRHEVTVSPGKVSTSQSSPQTVHVLLLRVSVSPQPEAESQQRPGHGAPAVDLPPSAFLRPVSSLCLHCPQSPRAKGQASPAPPGGSVATAQHTLHAYAVNTSCIPATSRSGSRKDSASRSYAWCR